MLLEQWTNKIKQSFSKGLVASKFNDAREAKKPFEISVNEKSTVRLKYHDTHSDLKFSDVNSTPSLRWRFVSVSTHWGGISTQWGGISLALRGPFHAMRVYSPFREFLVRMGVIILETHCMIECKSWILWAWNLQTTRYQHQNCRQHWKQHSRVMSLKVMFVRFKFFCKSSNSELPVRIRLEWQIFFVYLSCLFIWFEKLLLSC